ncbi:hypothetical protein SteCoe_30873 [Stentor coeruleus]|uniref:Uncharacterized protein n=1 Tax=Stentor coeruleus TaxID=5963 RepID=A0A1R2B2Q7_9CILI|nr:hypothetical protein SteCoe_30873 [Stentor coeruleus]
MDILVTNLTESLPLLYESIEKAEFLALDTEFTGLFSQDEDAFDESDTLEERYLKMRKSCESFFMCQLGISAFLFDTSSNSYNIRNFNIYTLPNSQSRQMCIHPSSMKFLVDNNFDMNKLFKCGISCSRIKESITQPHSNKTFHYKHGSLSEQNVMSYVSTILSYVNSKNNSPLIIDVPSNYVKKLLQGPAGALKHFRNLNYVLVLEENRLVMQITKINGKEPVFSPPTKENSMTSDEEIFNELGATLIFAAILKAQVPIVFHNGLFDLGYVYSHFVDSLGMSLDEFRVDVRTLFPDIYDTKTLAKSIDIQALNRLNLAGLYRCCLHSTDFKNTVRFSLDENFHSYLDEDKSHEAAYDAYITGVTFLHLREYLRKTTESKELWEGVSAYKNLICLSKSSKPYLNLNVSTQNNARNDYVIKFQVNREMDVFTIAEILSRYGDVLVRKIAKNNYVSKFDKVYNGMNMSSVIQELKMTEIFTFL